MWKHAHSVVLVFGFASTTHAGAILTYSTLTSDFVDGNTIWLDLGDGDGTVDVAVSVQGTPYGGIPGGLTLVDFTGFGESAPPGVLISDFSWTFPFADNPNMWFVMGLPDPQAATFAAPIPVYSGTAELAQFTVTLVDPVPLDFSLTLGNPKTIFGDHEFEFLPLDDDSHVLRFVVPEPASAIFVALAVLLPRRRMIS